MELTAKMVRNFQKEHMDKYINGMLDVAIGMIKQVGVSSAREYVCIAMTRFQTVAKEVYPEMLNGNNLLYFWKVENILRDGGFSISYNDNHEVITISWKEQEF